MIEAAADRLIGSSVDLDPAHGVGGRMRGSDGRSEWIEPVAAHVTSEAILAEEEAILIWAIDAQTPAAFPSTTTRGEGLDVLQRDAAASVAGHDRLALVVGPAGTGKTTMLRAAVDDLHAQHRFVYGVSPTAKAARTLERETGMSSDTVAKLLYEWSQPDRPPEEAWQLPPGTTLIVDEAGMIGTPNLHSLTRLASRNDWRLALVGDPRQLQAVGRGGMFTELCATGRTIELEHVHRFEQAWEARASLLLRQGDPRALDLYQQHGRIRAGTLEEHLDYFAHQWLQHHDAGATTAVMASTNQQVDRINDRIQSARHGREDLDPSGPVAIAGGEYAYVGDVVATRRNHRHLTTTTGERVRNRDLWTVTNTHDNGNLTVTPLSGHGQITLPANYITDHVRLGYAATEMGTQSDTVTTSLELASRATSCRNLYVAMTRGRKENTVCVITETHDLGEARDILDAVLTNDRADIPATSQRRNSPNKPTNRHRGFRPGARSLPGSTSSTPTSAPTSNKPDGNSPTPTDSANNTNNGSTSPNRTSTPPETHASRSTRRSAQHGPLSSGLETRGASQQENWTKSAGSAAAKPEQTSPPPTNNSTSRPRS